MLTGCAVFGERVSGDLLKEERKIKNGSVSGKHQHCPFTDLERLSAVHAWAHTFVLLNTTNNTYSQTIPSLVVLTHYPIQFY